MLSILIENWSLPIGRITLVTPNQKRAMPAEELKASWEQALRASKAFYNSESCMYNAKEKLDATADPELAARSAIDRAKRIHSPVYVIGSLYLLGEIRGAILAELEKE